VRNTDDCRCGHPETAHDAGECWTYPDAHDHPDPPCGCGWYEPVGGAAQ